MVTDRPAPKVSPHAWVPSTYFAEGFPYAVVNNLAEILFQQAGASLGLIGLTSLLHAPWNLKFLWANWIDRTLTKRRWMIAMQLGCAALLFVLAGLPVQAAALPWIAVAFLALALCSATNDIAIDAYYMEALEDEAQAKFVGYRATAYRLATLLVKGPLLGLAGAVGFAWGLSAMASILLASALLHLWLLPESSAAGPGLFSAIQSQLRRVPPSYAALGIAGVAALGLGWTPLLATLRGLGVERLPLSFWAAAVLVLVLFGVWLYHSRRAPVATERPALAALMATPRIGAALGFVIFFRTGESFLQKMKWPFLHEELGITVGQYAVLNGTFGVLAGFVGTFIGGLCIARHGLRVWFWPFIAAQNLPNLAYAGLAAAGPASTELGAAVLCMDELGSGLGTAVFMVYLMRLCSREHRAAHFAVLSALMSLSFTVAGTLSGFIAEAVGYGNYFALTFLATLPMTVLGFFAPGTKDARP